jgi:hypothetical protein
VTYTGREPRQSFPVVSRDSHKSVDSLDGYRSREFRTREIAAVNQMQMLREQTNGRPGHTSSIHRYFSVDSVIAVFDALGRIVFVLVRCDIPLNGSAFNLADEVYIEFTLLYCPICLFTSGYSGRVQSHLDYDSP